MSKPKKNQIQAILEIKEVSYNIQAVQGFIPIHELIQEDEVKMYSCAVAQIHGTTFGATLWFLRFQPYQEPIQQFQDMNERKIHRILLVTI